MTIRVLLVDDQPLLRTGFRMILEAEDDLAVVGEASDGAVAVEQVRILEPDVVLMDIRMPRMDGVEATRRIAALYPPADDALPDDRTPADRASGDRVPHDRKPGDRGPRRVPRVLVLTTFDSDEYVMEALRSGASGFLLKDVPADDLVDAIRVVASGEAVLAPTVTRRLLDRFADLPNDTGTSAPPRLSGLTDREVDVLKLVARGLSNAEIAAELFVGETTVKTHVGHLLTKLSLRDRVQAAVLAYETGLVRPGSF